MQYWTESAIYEETCPKCGGTVEFYKDDTNRKCGGCGHRMVNPRMDFGCAAYCPFAEQCLGTLPEEFVGNQDNLLKDRVAVEVKRYLKSDFRRIGRIMRQARHAEEIARDEGANLGITLCAAYLLDIGEVEAAASATSPSADQVIAAGQRLAENILGKLAAKEIIVREVATLIEAYHRRKRSGSTEIQVLADAAVLARLEEARKEGGVDDGMIRDSQQQLQTASGRRLAQRLVAG
jgi:DNA-directed RNA polymerase subunit RPC12/RpoP